MGVFDALGQRFDAQAAVHHAMRRASLGAGVQYLVPFLLEPLQFLGAFPPEAPGYSSDRL